MPTRNALATARLRYAQTAPSGPYRVTLQVWSHSFDHPDVGRRSALVNGVYLTQLPAASGYAMSNISIRDRYGVDQTGLWVRSSGANQEGWEGYVEHPPQSVLWAAYSGIYDERCLADAAVDRFRLQSYRASPTQIAVFNYLLGPVTFACDIVLPSPPTAVRLRLGHIGGNGGNPAQRNATLPDEEFVLQFA